MNFRSADVYSSLSAKKLLPVKFVNDDNLASVLYPFNPNGSPGECPKFYFSAIKIEEKSKYTL